MPHPRAGSSPSVSCQLGIPTMATLRVSPSVFWGSCAHRQKRLQFWNSPSSMTWTGHFDPLTRPKVWMGTSLTRVLCLLPLWLKRLTWNLTTEVSCRFCHIAFMFFLYFCNLWAHFIVSADGKYISFHTIYQSLVAAWSSDCRAMSGWDFNFHFRTVASRLTYKWEKQNAIASLCF